MVDIVEKIAGIKLKRTYKLDAPRASGDAAPTTRLSMSGLDWEPKISLEVGLEKTYRWIYDQIVTAERLQQVASR